MLEEEVSVTTPATRLRSAIYDGLATIRQNGVAVTGCAIIPKSWHEGGSFAAQSWTPEANSIRAGYAEATFGAAETTVGLTDAQHLPDGIIRLRFRGHGATPGFAR